MLEEQLFDETMDYELLQIINSNLPVNEQFGELIINNTHYSLFFCDIKHHGKLFVDVYDNEKYYKTKFYAYRSEVNKLNTMFLFEEQMSFLNKIISSNNFLHKKNKCEVGYIKSKDNTHSNKQIYFFYALLEE